MNPAPLRSSDDAAAVVAASPRPPPPGKDVVVVGASAGGLAMLRRLLAGLPADFTGSLFVVVHQDAKGLSSLPKMLASAGPLPALLAEDELPILPGHLYIAPPDRHLLLEPGRMIVVRGPRENRSRPSIDPLFRSAAWAYGPRVVGVLLSGQLDDGTAGLWAIKTCGGTSVVQEPADAPYPEMPRNALQHNRIDHVLSVDDMGALLAALAHEPIGDAWPAPPPELRQEIDYARLRRGLENGAPQGTPSAFTCPSCRGALWELEDAGHLRYRCHTGHAFTHGSLLVEHDSQMEEGLYVALRAVEQKALALRRLAENWASRFPTMRVDYEKQAVEMDDAALVLRNLLAGST